MRGFNFSNDAISEVFAALELGPAAVKSLLVRAHKKLRDKLTPYVQRGNARFKFKR